jgi:hypothetical protein
VYKRAVFQFSGGGWRTEAAGKAVCGGWKSIRGCVVKIENEMMMKVFGGR